MTSLITSDNAAKIQQQQQPTTPEQERLVEELARDRPTIHVAVTSFLSLVAARSLASTQTAQQTQSDTAHCVATNQQALQYSRQLLVAMNSTTIPAVADTAASNRNHEYPLVAQLWNGLIESNQKPTRFLGRRALRHAWIEIAATLKHEQQQQSQATDEQEQFALFVQEFQRLLFQDAATQNSHDDDDNDAALLWDSDGGKQELQRRQQRRQQQANKRVQQEQQQQQQQSGLPMIEEIAEEYVQEHA